jgi:hypothetical protein
MRANSGDSGFRHLGQAALIHRKRRFDLLQDSHDLGIDLLERLACSVLRISSFAFIALSRDCDHFRPLPGLFKGGAHLHASRPPTVFRNHRTSRLGLALAGHHARRPAAFTVTISCPPSPGLGGGGFVPSDCATTVACEGKEQGQRTHGGHLPPPCLLWQPDSWALVFISEDKLP